MVTVAEALVMLGARGGESGCALCCTVDGHGDVWDDDSNGNIPCPLGVLIRALQEANDEAYQARCALGRLQADVRGMRSVLGAQDGEGNLACAVRVSVHGCSRRSDGGTQ